MKRIFLRYAPLFIMLIFLSCAGAQLNNNDGALYKTEPFAPYKALDDGIPFVIEDYQNKSQGAALPAWLSAYFEGGVNAVEALDEYNGRYCFIADYTNISLDMLTRRALRVKPDRDFPPIALFRIYTRFIRNLNTSPDIVYGPVFEAFTKLCMTMRWTEPREEASCWIFVHWTEQYSLDKNAEEEDNEDATLGDVYKLFILMSVDKNIFQREFNTLAGEIQFDNKYDRTQAAAFRNVCETFFSGF